MGRNDNGRGIITRVQQATHTSELEGLSPSIATVKLDEGLSQIDEKLLNVP